MPTISDLPVTAVEVARLVREKQRSPVDVIRSIIARIEARNPSLNAVVHTAFDEAEHAARVLEAVGRLQVRVTGRTRPGFHAAIKKAQDDDAKNGFYARLVQGDNQTKKKANTKGVCVSETCRKISIFAYPG